MKVKINRVRAGSTGDQRNYGLVTGSIWNYEDKPTTNNVGTTLSPVPREEATIEAERGETVVGDLDNDGMVEHAKVGGKRHYQGGTPLNVPDGSFVFSDYSGLKIKNKELLKGIFNMPISKPVTPASVAKRYELNRYKQILNDPDSDPMDKKTAQLMIDNNMKKLGQLALVQEGMKGFPDGIPAIALPLMGSDMGQQGGQQKMKKGGLVRYQKAGTAYKPVPHIFDTNPFLSDEDIAAGRKYHLIEGDIPSWLTVGTAAVLGPKALRGAYNWAREAEYIPEWPGLTNALKAGWTGAKGLVKEYAPQIYNATKNYLGTDIGRGVGVAAAIKGAQMMGVGEHPTPVFGEDEVTNITTPTPATQDKANFEDFHQNNAYQQKQNQQKSVQHSNPTQGTDHVSKAHGRSDAEINAGIRTTIAHINGVDESYVTQDQIDAVKATKKLGGAALSTYQGIYRSQVEHNEPIYNVADKEVMDAATQKQYEAVRPWSHYNPNLPYIGSQLPSKGNYEVSPQGIIYHKGTKAPNIDEQRQYPIDWSSYGSGGFEDYKRDIAAAKGKESSASKWWVDKVNKYAIDKTGKPIFDMNVQGVNVPGYEWSTPAWFKEKKQKTREAVPEVGQDYPPAESTDPKFQGQSYYGLGEPFPEDVMGLVAAGAQRIPQYGAVYNQTNPSLLSPQYRNANLEPLSAVTQAIQQQGSGPQARASAMGVAGKALEAGNQEISQNRLANEDMFMKTQAANMQALNQSNAMNSKERGDYMADVNAIHEGKARDLNAKDALFAKMYGKLVGDQRQQMGINAQYPYQYQTPYGITVNPTLRSIYDEPMTGVSSFSNYAALYNSMYKKFTESMTNSEAAKAASDYIRAINSSKAGTSSAASSIYDF